MSITQSFVAEFAIPVVVTGFEPLDLINGLCECVQSLEKGEPRLSNQYERSVRTTVNVHAQRLMEQVYEIVDSGLFGLCYTVTPLFFPGGDIGKLAVFGTVNDLAVSGAIPRWLSLSLVIEEGLPWKTLDRVLDSIQAAAASAYVMIVTGDTKVVPRGAVDQLFITTSGIGELEATASPGPELLGDGDVLIASGPIGCHGASILCPREHLEFDPIPTSDCANVTAPLVALQRAGVAPRAIRDATRGGIAAILQEWAESSRRSCVIEDALIPLNAEVRSLCELLGLDPLHLANEGTFLLATAPEFVESTMKILHQHAVSSRATVIGKITPRRVAPVMVVRGIGREVVLDEPIGAPLPRIC